MCGCMIIHAAMDHEAHQPAPVPQTLVMHESAAGQCAHCGYPLSPGFAYCPNCGMSLKTSKCPACGQKVDPSWRACAYCGSPLGEKE